MRTLTILLLLLLAGCFSPEGETFKDVDAIAMSDTWEDWVVVGRFGPTGPFTLTDFKSCDFGEPCSFSHNGQGHYVQQFSRPQTHRFAPRERIG